MFIKLYWLHLELILLMFIVLITESSSLKSMKIIVPEVVRSGDTVTLSCEYDLEQVALYTIKWYRNDEEFYRFVPKESPPFRAFTVQYINVDISRSGPTEVTLKGVRRELSGIYKCEVSADAPLFHTDIKIAEMIVAELPSGNPVMNIEPEKVEIGKRIKADCYSPGSDPAANLTWYINEEQITEEDESMKIFPNELHTDQALGLHSMKSKLEIITNRSQFIQGIMTVRCEATVYSLWNESVESSVRDFVPHLAPALGSTSSQSHTNEIAESDPNASWSRTMLSMEHLVIFAIFVWLCR